MYNAYFENPVYAEDVTMEKTGPRAVVMYLVYSVA